MKNATIIYTAAGVFTLGLAGVLAYRYKQSQTEVVDNEEVLIPAGNIPAAAAVPKYKLTQKVYANSTAAIEVNIAKKTNNTWSGTGENYGNFNKGEEVGIIEHVGIVPAGMEHAGQPFYIVRNCAVESYSLFGYQTPTAFCTYGVVIENQITNIK